ncbi:MAG: C40 family peptidase [Sulfuricellaceae bacterium]|jgi:cell wall-associated NlpC family hydrolase
MSQRYFLLAILLSLLAGCSSLEPQRGAYTAKRPQLAYQDSAKRNDVVMYAFGLISVDYRFGGANPESGLDCSGMVSYIYQNSLGLKLPHNAARIAQLGRDIRPAELRPGDLVFFNTQNRPYSHVGIYIGDDRFIHAPHTNGKIEVSSLKNRYFAQRFEAARTFFN